MTNSRYTRQPIERIPSGITGLDTILRGGFLQGGIYIILGEPGAGKTILANQICFDHVARGGRAVYVTLLAETHARMLAHLQSLDFFTPEPIADALYYVSGYSTLMDEGLDGLLSLIRKVVRDHSATILVIDGLVTAEAVASSELAFKQFIHGLQVQNEAIGCTTFLLAQTGENDPSPEHTMVDGLIELKDKAVGLRAVRELTVRKFRGSSYLRGRHLFKITDAGIVVYPRTEALLASPPAIAGEDRTRLAFGVPRLDEMIEGGVLSGSTTMILGPTGAGKTILGLHFLAAGARRGESGLHFGFYETPPRLIGKADAVGLDFSRHVERGEIGIMWQPALEELLDVLADRLLDAVHRRRVRRLFIDGLNGFHQSAAYPERLTRFFTAITNELRALDVTTLFTVESPYFVSPSVAVPFAGISLMVENIIMLRYVELRSQLYRLISIMKMRESRYDSTIREFKISGQGIDVAATFESAETILSGLAQIPPESAKPPGPEREPRGKDADA